MTNTDFERDYLRFREQVAPTKKKNVNGKPSGHAASQDQSGESAWSDPDWSILDDRRGELPEFPLDVLSPQCRDWVERAAHGAGATPAHVAVPMLSIASGLIGTSRRVQASRSWTQPMTFWSAIVGFSGTHKTPGIDATKRALSMIERDDRTKIADLLRKHQGRVEAAKAAKALWKEEVKKAAEGSVVSLANFRDVKGSQPVMPAEAVDPGPFVAPRLYVSDATIERLAVLLQVRPQGMLLIADELAALFLNMSRYSGGQDNEFWLEAWNGNSYTVERMGRDPLVLDHLLIGVVGGLQPDKLSRSFKGDADGMYARICFSWPSEPEYRPLTNEVSEIEPEIVNALRRLIEMEGGSGKEGEFAPRAIPLAAEGAESFEAFRFEVHQGKSAIDGREREWWAKAPANVLRIAGTLTFLSWAMAGGDEPKEIGVNHLDAAVRLVSGYFWPHSRAALRQIGLSERHADSRRALQWASAMGLREVSREQIRREALGHRLDAEQAEKLLDRLTTAGWMRKVLHQTTGRTRQRWEVNPKLFGSSVAGMAQSPESPPVRPPFAGFPPFPPRLSHLQPAGANQRDDMMTCNTEDPDLDPVEDALERSPWCVMIPIEGYGWDDADLHGPFATHREASAWALNYAGAIIRKMASPEFVVLHHRERQEDEAWKRPRN